MRRPGTVLVLAGLLAMVPAGPVAAQSPSPATDAMATGTPGATSLVALPSASFAVSMPLDWVVLEPAGDPVAAARFREAHPELAPLVDGLLATGPMAALAFAPAVEGDPIPTAFAAFRGPNMGMDATSMLTLTLNGLERVPDVLGNVTSELIELDGTPALAVGYDWTLRLPDGTALPARVEQFTVITPETVWVFSITDDVAAPDAWRSLADSFRFLPG
jgi:hypothetical protein